MSAWVDFYWNMAVGSAFVYAWTARSDVARNPLQVIPVLLMLALVWPAVSMVGVVMMARDLLAKAGAK